MQKWQIWLQAFLAALAAFLQAGLPVHTAAQQARSAADEAIQHIHPDVLAGKDSNPAQATIDPANPIPDPNPPGEDDNEQARRQPTLVPAGVGADAETDVEHERR